VEFIPRTGTQYGNGIAERLTDGSRGIHPTDGGIKMEMRRVATLEIGLGTAYSPVADATAAIFRAADPWLESHGYHHASAPRGANGIA
jgi:hypothetical protein